MAFGCEDGRASVDDGGVSGDAGGSRVDGGGPPGTDGGGPPPSTACDTAPATTGSSGERTAFPHIDAFVTPARFQLLSVNFVVTESDDPRGDLLEMFLEVQNSGSEVECRFVPDVTLDFQEIVGLLETPPHYTEFVMTVVSDCLSPGDVGVMRGVARGIGTDDLATAASLQVDLTPSTESGSPATGVPTLSGQRVESSAEGFVIRGQVTPVTTIRNYGYTAYARDSRGLLFAELLAFPGELATLPAGSPIDFETGPTPCEISEYVEYQGWIVE